MIPKQVEETADMAMELYNQLYKEQNPQAAEEGETSKEEVVEEEVKSEQEEETTEIAPPTDDQEELTYKERYLSLKGKYDKEVPTISRELKDLKEKVFERIDNLQQTQSKQEEVPVVTNERVAKFREEYGDEFVETLLELVKEGITPVIDERVKPIATQVSGVEDVQLETARENFNSYLSSKVKGDWNAVLSDPKFNEFLAKPDPSGLYTYGDLVDKYNEKWDADKLAIVFNTFIESNPVEKQKNTRNPSRDANIAPSRNTTANVPNVEEKKIWTSSMIDEFKVADRKNKYNPEVSKALWDDLLQAMVEGRIRG